MRFLDDMEAHANCLNCLRMQQQLAEYVETVFLAFRVLNVLNLIPAKKVIERRFQMDPQKVEDIMWKINDVDENELFAEAQTFNGYDDSKRPNERIWINEGHAMQHAQKSVPSHLLEDNAWVSACMKFLSQVLAPQRRGLPVFEAAIFLLKSGVGFNEVVMLSAPFCHDAEVHDFHPMTTVQKEAFVRWLSSMDYGKTDGMDCEEE
jgi:hypothetical protein